MISPKGESHLGYEVNSHLFIVRKICTDIMNRTIDGVNFKSLISKTRYSFQKNKLNVIIKTKRIHSLIENEFFVNAYYDHEADKHNDSPIEVDINHNINPTNKFEFDQLSQFIVQIYDAVVHELRHQFQSRSRNYISYNCETTYLGDPDEIDAYSLSIAIELIRNLGKERAIRYLHRASRLSKIRPKGLYASPTLFAYFNEFREASHPVIKRLIKKVYTNLERLDNSAIFY